METQDKNYSSGNMSIGMIKKGTQNFIDQIPGKAFLQELQKIVLTSTAHILRKTPQFKT